MFEEILSPRRDLDRTSARRLSFPAAVSLHVVAFAALVGASMWTTEEPFRDHTTSCGWPGPVPIVFHPVAVQAGQSGPPRSAAGHVKSHRVAQLAPLGVPQQLPAEVAPTDPEADGPGDAQGTEENPFGQGGPGVPGTVPGGIGTRQEPLVDLEGTPRGDIRAPDLVRRIEPVYPEAARRARMEGLVVLDAIIAVSGEIEDVRVVKSGGPLFDSAAADAVRHWKYRPATLNGRAVRVLLTVSVSFRLH